MSRNLNSIFRRSYRNFSLYRPTQYSFTSFKPYPNFLKNVERKNNLNSNRLSSVAKTNTIPYPSSTVKTFQALDVSKLFKMNISALNFANPMCTTLNPAFGLELRLIKNLSLNKFVFISLINNGHQIDITITEEYYQNGKHHRDDSNEGQEKNNSKLLKSRPAIIVRDIYGIVILEEYHKHGEYHRLDGPAVIRRDSNGVVILEEYHQYGRYHRINGPAAIERNSNGVVILEEYCRGGKYHRFNGPAIIKCNDRGATEMEKYYYNGEYRGCIIYDADGNKIKM